MLTIKTVTKHVFNGRPMPGGVRKALRAKVYLFVAGQILFLSCFGYTQNAKQLKLAHPSNALPLTGFYDTPHPLPPGKPGDLIRSEATNQYSLPYEISAFRILYHSRNSKDEDTPVSAVVLVPDGKAPADGWPVIAWAHEFRGASRQSAPSLLRNLGVGPLLAMYANLGYAVVATDFAGLGVDAGNAVIDARINALDVINSITAARSAVKEIGHRWIAVGVAHGASAVLAIAESDQVDQSLLGTIAMSWQAAPPLKRFKVPLLVISGEQGQASALEVTANATGVAQLCRSGDRVLLLKYPNLDASGAMSASAGDQISWIKARFAGASAPSNCH